MIAQQLKEQETNAVSHPSQIYLLECQKFFWCPLLSLALLFLILMKTSFVTTIDSLSHVERGNENDFFTILNKSS